jgi:hypothetical protein
MRDHKGNRNQSANKYYEEIKMWRHGNIDILDYCILGGLILAFVTYLWSYVCEWKY